MFIPVWLLVVLFLLVWADGIFRELRYRRREQLLLEALKRAETHRDFYLAQLDQWSNSHGD